MVRATISQPNTEERFIVDKILLNKKEAGELWGMALRRAQFLCANGKVNGAQNIERHRRLH